MPQVIEHYRQKLKLNADSVEWCPIHGHTKYLAVCTYQLTGETRSGLLYLFELSETGLKEVQVVETSGLLDCKWSPVPINESIYLATVDALGCLKIYSLTDGQLDLKKSLVLCSGLLLSLDWSNSRIVASDSNGNIHLVDFNGTDLSQRNTWKLHEFEAWIAAFDYWDVNAFYSGGDDCKFKSFDLRVGRAVTTSTEHNAGVTTVRCHHLKEHIIATGSYDENIRFWDVRHIKRPTEQLEMPGGVWRVKWEPHKGEELAACCMYGGSAVVTPTQILAEYKAHESINYGIDWCHSKSNSEFNGNIAVCSFYDNLLSLAYYLK